MTKAVFATLFLLAVVGSCFIFHSIRSEVSRAKALPPQVCGNASLSLIREAKDYHGTLIAFCENEKWWFERRGRKILLLSTYRAQKKEPQRLSQRERKRRSERWKES